MIRIAVAAVSVALIGVFALITLSVVNARRPLDAQVKTSFESVATEAGGTALGCVKTRVDYYACAARVRPLDAPSPQRVNFTLAYRENGCWTALVAPALRTRFQPLKGCIASG